MRVYYVTMHYHDAMHNKTGYYKSPSFSTRELAQQFLNNLIAEGTNAIDNQKVWITNYDGYKVAYPKDAAVIQYEDVLNKVPPLKNAIDYLHLTDHE